MGEAVIEVFGAFVAAEAEEFGVEPLGEVVEGFGGGIGDGDGFCAGFEFEEDEDGEEAFRL